MDGIRCCRRLGSIWSGNDEDPWETCEDRTAGILQASERRCQRSCSVCVFHLSAAAPSSAQHRYLSDAIVATHAVNVGFLQSSGFSSPHRGSFSVNATDSLALIRFSHVQNNAIIMSGGKRRENISRVLNYLVATVAEDVGWWRCVGYFSCWKRIKYL